MKHRTQRKTVHLHNSYQLIHLMIRDFIILTNGCQKRWKSLMLVMEQNAVNYGSKWDWPGAARLGLRRETRLDWIWLEGLLSARQSQGSNYVRSILLCNSAKVFNSLPNPSKCTHYHHQSSGKSVSLIKFPCTWALRFSMRHKLFQFSLALLCT